MKIVSMIILIIANVICFDKYGGVNAIEYDTSYIDKHKEDAMSFLKDAEVGKLEKTMNENYFDCKEIKEEERDKYEKCREEANKMKESAINAKEQEYKSYNLKRKGEEWAEQGGSTGEGMSKAEKDASEAFLNVHNNKGAELAVNSYREINKDMALGNEITKNPMVRVNSKQETTDGDMLEGGECAVSDREDGADEVKLEEYEEIIEDTEIEEEVHVCEKDVRGPFYCEERLEDLECESKGDCGRNVGGVLLDSVQSGIVYRYDYPKMTFGNVYGIGSGYMSDSEARRATEFRCGTNCCAVGTIRANFQIKDKEKVGVFKLDRVTSAHPAMIKLNGEVIYHSFGGYKLEKTGRYASNDQFRSFYAKNGHWDAPREWRSLISTGNGEYSCYPNNIGFLTFRAGDSGRTTAGGEYFRPIDNRDLRQKLREGSNQLEITLAHDDMGFIETEFYLQQYCCQKWKDKWQGDCPK